MRSVFLPCTLTGLQAAFLLLASVYHGSAQRIVVGGGVNVGTVPRALAPLCGSARRLNGVGLTGRIGIATNSIRVSASVDYLARVGVVDAAECIARSGIVVDSTFEPANRAATSFSAGAWIPVINGLEIGAESGIVYGRSSWFIGPAIGGQYGRVRAEAIARRHVTSFDEVTRDYGSGTTREISRTDRAENAWGVVTRFLLLTR